MTKLEYDADSIFDLEVGNSVRLGDVSYKIKKFSRGGMGFIIYLCQSNSRPSEKFSIHGQRVVIKAALGDDSGNIQNLFLRELTIWAGFRNRNIINLNEIIQIDNVYAAAMNWCHGSLREYISNNEKLAPEISFYVIDSIISALSYACRNHSVFHLDLKPENVLYDKRYEPYGLFMVSDWGISSIRGELAKHANLSNLGMGEIAQTFNQIGTIPYMAPERFEKNIKSSIASDVFSIGMILYEMLVGYLPFDKNIEIRNQISDHRYMEIVERSIHENLLSRKFGNLVRSMVHPDLSLRISNYEELSIRIKENSPKRSLFSSIFKK